MGLKRWLRKIFGRKAAKASMISSPSATTEAADEVPPAEEVQDSPVVEPETPEIKAIDPPRRNSEDEKLAIEKAARSRFQNLSDVALHRLPAELFIDILLRTIDWHAWTLGRVHNLAQVSSYWHDTVTSCPLFWPEVDVEQKPEIQAIVLKKNAHGPLAVRCTKKIDDAEKRKAFLEIVTQHAHRWRTLFFQGKFPDDVCKQLETAAPLLSELFVYQYPGDNIPQKQLKLPEGTSFRHIDLDFITVPWDSDRLSGLETIQLRRLTGNLPSLAQLCDILTSSPRLTWLTLAELKEAEESDKFKAKIAVPRGRKPIHLPFLTTLVFQDIPRHISYHLLSSIDTPSCTCLIADDAHSDHFRYFGSTFSRLMTTSMEAQSSTTMTYDGVKGLFRIASQPTPEVSNEWMPWMKRTPGIDMVVQSSSPQQLPECCREVITSIDFSASRTSDCLILRGAATVPEGSYKDDCSSTFPYEILRKIPSVVRLESTGHIHVHQVLDYLASPSCDAEGTLKWPCPALATLDLGRCQSDTEALLEQVLDFGKRRYPRGLEDNTESGIQRPVKLDKILVPDAIVEKVKVEMVFEGEVL